jgi:hypothetical protein
LAGFFDLEVIAVGKSTFFGLRRGQGSTICCQRDVGGILRSIRWRSAQYVVSSSYRCRKVHIFWSGQSTRYHRGRKQAFPEVLADRNSNRNVVAMCQ